MPKHTIDEINSFDLKSYTGQHFERYDQDGNILEQSDTRTLLGEKARRLRMIKELATRHINKEIPQWKLTNVALGIYDTDKNAEIIAQLQAHRATVADLEQQLADAEDMESTEKIMYNTSFLEN